MALSSIDLTLVRPRRFRLRSALHAPVAVLLASCVLAGALLVAVSDVVARLG
jgi:ABC-type cobalamin transport system permease subunit